MGDGILGCTDLGFVQVRLFLYSSLLSLNSSKNIITFSLHSDIFSFITNLKLLLTFKKHLFLLLISKMKLIGCLVQFKIKKSKFCYLAQMSTVALGVYDPVTIDEDLVNTNHRVSPAPWSL